jgi:hypothetical protein
MSDAHIEQWREPYFLRQGLDYILAFYYEPFRRHFRETPADRLVHFPWSVPERWISKEVPRFHGQRHVMVFGASEHEAYALRNWCRRQPGVESYDHSGCDNKVIDDEDFFGWLSGFDAVVAAGSEDPKYRLTTPKYFETAAVGSLLFAQHTDDLARLHFRDNENCMVFNKSTFRRKVDEYLGTIEDSRWLEMRTAGRELIREHHTVERRLAELASLVQAWPGR